MKKASDWMRKITAAAAFFLSVILLTASVGVSSFASESSAEEQLSEQAQQLHEQALALYSRNTGNRSFYGNCGIYVGYLMHCLGISDYLGGHNGNQWFDAFQDGEVCGGFTAVRYPGKTCVTDLIQQQGDVNYVLVSYTHQTYYSDENPGAGHVIFIQAIRDGMAYFTESYGMYGVSEGQVHVWDLERLLDTYQSWYGNPIGAVWFADKNPADPAETMSETGTTEAAVRPSLPELLQAFSCESDENSGMLSLNTSKITAAQWTAQFQDFSPVLLSEEGAGIAENAFVGTGMMCLFAQDQTVYSYVLSVAGDLNGSGTVSSADARLALRRAAGLLEQELSESVALAADINRDGKINSADARKILRICAKLEQ